MAADPALAAALAQVLKGDELDTTTRWVNRWDGTEFVAEDVRWISNGQPSNFRKGYLTLFLRSRSVAVTDRWLADYRLVSHPRAWDSEWVKI